ncbi:MAG: glutamine synthetase family protein [Pseudomonadota bacterium]
MPGNLTLDALAEDVDLGLIDTVIMAQTDMQGRLMGKRFHARHFLDSGVQETHACNYLLTTDVEMEPVPGYAIASWNRGYGDDILRPDLSTMRRVPWLEGTALVLCDVFDHDGAAEVPVSPRAILKAQIARATKLGLQPMMASELEFYLFKESYEAAHGSGYRGLTPVSTYNEDYHIFQTSKEEGVMRAIRNGLFGAGVPVENTKGEAWAGQEEVNVRYSDALDAADTHVITKNAVKEISWAKGFAATFMAKYDTTAAGSSCHIHQSLVAQDGPAFFDAAAPDGMSTLMRQYLAGLLTHASEATLFLAPNVNSYKRFQVGTFAPTKAVWSHDNRTAGYRIVAQNSPALRIETRIGGADLNPYLAFAAQIAAGLAGIAGGYVLEDAFAGDAYGGEGREIPKTLRGAIAALDRSEALRAAMGDAVIDHYLHAARWEQAEHDRCVTDWEIFRGFERN